MSKRIRVLHVAEAAGGVERYLQDLFKFNDDNKVENMIITSNRYSKDAFIDTKAKHIIIPMTHELSTRKDLESIKIIRKYIKSLKPDIVYAHSSKAGGLARLANIGLKNKVIYNPHGWAFNIEQSNKKRQFYGLVEKMLAPVTDKIVCISQSEINSALKNKICQSEKLQLIYNGIDIEKVENTEPINREKVGIPKDAFVVGQVGRLSKQKSPDIFVKAAVKIKEKIPNAFFLLVGDGDEREQVEYLIKQHNLEDSFKITGWIDNPSEYMKIMNIGTLLSRWEGFGLVLPEYMIDMVPVVASSVDAIPEIIKDNKTGFLVNADSPEEVAKKVNNIYFESTEQCNELLQNAYQFAQGKFSAGRMTKDVFKVYKNII